MKALYHREGLLSAFQLASVAVPARDVKPILRNLKAIADGDRCTLLATDLELGIRLDVLGVRVEERGLTVGPEVLAWLADHLPGGLRQLDGALTQLEELLQQPGTILTVPLVAEQFREQANAARVTVERIAQRVGGYFQMEPRQLQSRRRYRGVLVPRQIGMYLARQLTALSLEQIGAYFGGRDHTTVLHACRKVERALTEDAALSGAVRQLHADLA